jgi:hypothetical protein
MLLFLQRLIAKNRAFDYYVCDELIIAVMDEHGMNPSRHPMRAKFQGPLNGSSPQRHRTWLKLNSQPIFHKQLLPVQEATFHSRASNDI